MVKLKLFDTQIISYKFNDTKNIDTSNGAISSIVAIEFLQMQYINANKARYYIPVNISYPLNQIKIDHPFNKYSTDSILFYFNQLHAPFKIFSNIAVSNIINKQDILLFNRSVQFLDKAIQKDLKKKFRFIIESQLTCIPIAGQDIEIGFTLLYEFLLKNNAKKNFRNTWNDILILSKAINSNMQLITEDKLLNNFACDSYNAKKKRKDNILEIDFSDLNISKVGHNNDSKGYINNSWKYKINNGTFL